MTYPVVDGPFLEFDGGSGLVEVVYGLIVDQNQLEKIKRVKHVPGEILELFLRHLDFLVVVAGKVIENSEEIAQGCVVVD